MSPLLTSPAGEVPELVGGRQTCSLRNKAESLDGSICQLPWCGVNTATVADFQLPVLGLEALLNT